MIFEYDMVDMTGFSMEDAQRRIKEFIELVEENKNRFD